MMNRINKITVAVKKSENGNEYNVEAKLYKTHKLVETLDTTDLIDLVHLDAGIFDQGTHKSSTVRETVRVQLMQPEVLESVDCHWDPKQEATAVDMTDENEITSRAIELVTKDMNEWMAKLGVESSNWAIVGDGMTEMEDKQAHYGNGKWAWATIGLDVEIEYAGQIVHVVMDARVVSGQISKPKMINEHKYNYSGLIAEMAEEIPEMKTMVRTTPTKKAPITASQLIDQLAKMELTDEQKQQLAELSK